MKNLCRLVTIFAFAALSLQVWGTIEEPNKPASSPKVGKAVVISLKGMIDDGLYQSIKRRTQQAMEDGATHVIYEIGTYGGLVYAADDISKYFIHDIRDKVHTVAYVTTEAISAGAWISVSCNDIIMKENTKIGDCAPISMEGKIEGVEREKQESYIRASFRTCGQANNYPVPILEAMVTQQIEVWGQKDASGKWEFMERDQLGGDPNKDNHKNRKLIDSKDSLVTLTSTEAREYGVARAVVRNIDEVLDFISKRDNVTFQSGPAYVDTNWSEEMVRWVNSPTVAGILLMIGLLGIYIEFNHPGVVLPAVVAVIAFTILFGSKYLIGLANYIEIVVFVAGLILVVIELFVLPHFGLLGGLGILMMFGGFVAMFLPNTPGEVPWPRNPFEWQMLKGGLTTMAIGFIGFVVGALILAQYLPKTRLFGQFVLAGPSIKAGQNVSMTAPAETKVELNVGDEGQVLSPLRPSGRAIFGEAVVDVVAQAEFLPKGSKVSIVAIEGNRVVVKAC
jgi:membrane-bound serine protease (ClpP class)